MSGTRSRGDSGFTSTIANDASNNYGFSSSGNQEEQSFTSSWGSSISSGISSGSGSEADIEDIPDEHADVHRSSNDVAGAGLELVDNESDESWREEAPIKLTTTTKKRLRPTKTEKGLPAGLRRPEREIMRKVRMYHKLKRQVLAPFIARLLLRNRWEELIADLHNEQDEQAVFRCRLL